MKKRFIISEQEKKSILEMYEKRGFKRLLMEYDKSKDVLNEKGQYITQNDVELLTNNSEESRFIKAGTVVWGESGTGSIKFWQNYTAIKNKSYSYKEMFYLGCDEKVVYLQKQAGEGQEFAEMTDLTFTTTNPSDFIPKLQSMFCCGGKLKEYNLRPGSRAWAKPGEEGYTCKGKVQTYVPQDKFEIPNKEWCSLMRDPAYFYAKRQDGWYFTRKEPINWKKLDGTKYPSAITKLEDPTNGAKNIKTDKPCGT